MPGTKTSPTPRRTMRQHFTSVSYGGMVGAMLLLLASATPSLLPRGWFFQGVVSGGAAAIGYAIASGLPYTEGLIKNRYIGRTFIQPSQTIRQLGIRLKLNPLKEVIRGKRLIVVDDSIVRGNTQRAQVRMLREAGAAEVHVRIASSPVRWPCFYGIDFASPAELIANGMDADEPEAMVEGVRQAIGADSLGYISIDEMVAATEQPGSQLCKACFNGQYPIALPTETAVGKAVLESLRGAPGVDPLTVANDNVSAVMRP